MIDPDEVNAAVSEEVALYIGRETLSRITAQVQAVRLEALAGRLQAQVQDLQAKLPKDPPEPDAAPPARKGKVPA